MKSSAEMADAPIVFQCGGCRRVVSDSNQLVAAVAELDALVLDAVVGVRIDNDTDGSFSTLRCAACCHTLGRRYAQPPQPALIQVVHRLEAPRYALSRAALESYVLGSAQVEHDAQLVNGIERHPMAAGVGGSASHLEIAAESAARIVALQQSEADMRLQLGQVMRVVLALDQRLKALESGSISGASATDEEPGRKRRAC